MVMTAGAIRVTASAGPACAKDDGDLDLRTRCRFRLAADRGQNRPDGTGEGQVPGPDREPGPAPLPRRRGAHIYYQFAALWPGEEGASALPAPGFAVGEHLPADAAALVSLQAQTVLEHAGDAPFVMLGTSSGGLLAYEVARHRQTRLDGVSAVVDVPGNHFSMMDEHAETTTRAVHDWLGLGHTR